MDKTTQLGNMARADIVDKALKAKNKVLREYSEAGVPDGAFVPRSMTQYRLWEDATIGLIRLGSPNSVNLKDSENTRADLIREASGLIVKLRATHKKQSSEKRKSPSNLYARDQEEIKRLNKLVRGMTSTIQQLKNELEVAVTGRDQMCADYANLKRELDVLRRSVGKSSGLRVISSVKHGK
jgi:hypothetical protein